jgi:peptide/nickel transport system permease protein
MSAQGAMTLEFADLRRPRRLAGIKLRSLLTLIPCVLVIAGFVGVGLFAPALAPHDPKKVQLLDKLEPPAWEADGSWGHPLGTDNLGRDELSRLIHGTRVSLTVVGVTVPLSALIGVTVGLLSGWYRGPTDKLLMRVVDVQLALPAILFAILLAAVFGPSLRNVIILIVVWSWSSYARIIRGEVLSLRERDFVLASRAAGAGDGRIILRHLLPNVLNSVVVFATLEIASVILVEAALSFLGVGVAPGTASWGAMVSEGRTYISIAWWLIAIPGAAIFLVSLVANFMGDWLRDALDPRLKNIR